MLPLPASALATARLQDGAPSVGAQERGNTIPGRCPPSSGGACCHQQGATVHIIWTILIGFIAGLLARAVLPGNNSMGFILTAVLGIAGSLVATYAGQAMGWYSAGAGAGFIASVVGAAVLLGVWHLVSR